MDQAIDFELPDQQGATWIAYVVHKPFGPEALEAYTARPKEFDNLAPKGGGDQVRLLRFADGKAGERLFGESSDRKPMRLISTRTVDDLALLTYETARDA